MKSICQQKPNANIIQHDHIQLACVGNNVGLFCVTLPALCLTRGSNFGFALHLQGLLKTNIFVSRKRKSLIWVHEWV